MVLVAALCANTAPVRPAGAGTELDPFLIANIANLRYLSENPSIWGEIEVDWDEEEYELVEQVFFKQTADIDASETANWNDGEGFSPIGRVRFPHGSEDIGPTEPEPLRNDDDEDD